MYGFPGAKIVNPGFHPPTFLFCALQNIKLQKCSFVNIFLEHEVYLILCKGCVFDGANSK